MLESHDTSINVLTVKYVQLLRERANIYWALTVCKVLLQCFSKYQFSQSCNDQLPNQFSSVQSLSHVQLFVTPRSAARQASLSITNSQSLPKPMSISWWCHPTISSSAVPFSSFPQSFPTSESFPMSQLFASGGQSIGVSASTSDLPLNTQDRFALGWTVWISLQSKGLSRVFSNTTDQKHQFFGIQLSLQSNSHIHTWLQKKT